MRKWLLVLAALSLAACDEKKQAPVVEVIPPVLVVPAKLENLAPERRLAGVVAPRVESTLGFRVNGKVTRRLVDAGARVTAGQVLAELDREDFALQLAQAEAELATARTAKEAAAAELERVNSLRRAGWSTASEHDRQRALAEEASGRAARAEHALSLARNALDYTTLRADTDGVVTAVLAEPGQVVASGQPVLRLARTDELEVDVSVPETMIELARSGQAEVTLWAQPDKTIPATLRELSPRADPATRTYPARFSLPAGAPGVTWGMTATVRLRESGPLAGAKGTLLPLSAILDEGRGPGVFVVDAANGTVSRREVKLARFGAEFAVVLDGLKDGDLVVQLGAQKLAPGQRVRPVTRLPS